MDETARESKRAKVMSAPVSLEDFKRDLVSIYEKILCVLVKKLKVDWDEAMECLHSAIASILFRWSRKGEPPVIRDQFLYLVHASLHARYRRRKWLEGLKGFTSGNPESEGVLLCPPAIRRKGVDATLRDEWNLVREAVKTLPPRQKEAFSLVSMGFNTRQAADLMKTTPGNVRILKHTALMGLRKALGISA